MTPQEIKREITLRCKEDGDCLLWTMALNSGDIPVMHIRGKKGVHSVRRLLLEADGVSIPKGSVATTTCGNPRCLAHVAVWTRQQLQQRSSQKVSANVSRSAKIAAIKRQGAKLTQEKVDHAKATGMTGQQFADWAGISFGHACRVLRGENWKDYRSPWAGLLPANGAMRRAA